MFSDGPTHRELAPLLPQSYHDCEFCMTNCVTGRVDEYAFNVRQLGTLRHFDHVLLENALFWGNGTHLERLMAQSFDVIAKMKLLQQKGHRCFLVDLR